MAGNTALQAWREVPFAEFSPYIPLKKLPDGAYLGQIVATVGPDQPMFRVVQNSDTAIEKAGHEGEGVFVPKAVELSYTSEDTDNNVIRHVPTHGPRADGDIVAMPDMRDNYRVNSGRIKVPLAVTGDVDTDDYQGGYMCVIEGPGTGQIYNIHTNSKSQTKGVRLNANNITNVNVSNFFLEEGLRISFTENTRVRLVKNQYKDVVLATTRANLCCGFALTPVPAEYYFLAQIRGACLVYPSAVGGIRLDDADDAPRVKIYKAHNGKVLVEPQVASLNAQEIGYVLEPRDVANSETPFMAMLDIV